MDKTVCRTRLFVYTGRKQKSLSFLWKITGREAILKSFNILNLKRKVSFVIETCIKLTILVLSSVVHPHFGFGILGTSAK